LVRPPLPGSAQAKGGEDRQPGPVPQVSRFRSKELEDRERGLVSR
jgi:hypothetical protein